MLIGAGFSVVATVLVWSLAGLFVRAMQLEPEAADLAQRYIAIIGWVLPLLMAEQVAAACLRGAGDTWTGFIAKLVVNALNTFFSAVLVIGAGLFPKLGWEGLAVGTAIGHGVGGLLLLIVLWRGRSGLQISLADLRPDWQLITRILRVGVPGGFDLLAVIACHLVYVSIINRLGTASAAAHGMGVQIEALSYLPGTAFQVTAATMAGQSLGAGSSQAAMAGVRR
jgi:putative MATE family efflux protein